MVGRNRQQLIGQVVKIGINNVKDCCCRPIN